MRKILAFIAAVLFTSLISHASEPPTPPLTTNKTFRVLLTWDPNPEADIAGYRIWYGTNSRVYPVIVDVGNVTNTIVTNLLMNTKWYFAATAYNTSSLESDLSEEVSLTTPGRPSNPTGLNISQVPVYIIDILAGDIPGEWETTRTLRLVVDTDRAYQFFSVSNRMELTPAIKID